MPAYDHHCGLWPTGDESFFRERTLRPVQQEGPRCVATCLGILSGDPPAGFRDVINTQVAGFRRSGDARFGAGGGTWTRPASGPAKREGSRRSGGSV